MNDTVAGLLPVCTEDEVPEKGGLRIERPELPESIVIFRYAEQYHAVSELCSHAGASLLGGKVVDCEVACPLHFARFDLRTGQACSLPAIAPIEVYPLKVSDGIIHVVLPSRE